MKKHKTREETERRTIRKWICAQPGCRFKGKPTQQGVCFENTGEVSDFSKLDKHEAELVAELKQMKKREGSAYTKVLEGYYLCAMMNWTSTLDECIRLRRDSAIIRDKIAKMGRK